MTFFADELLSRFNKLVKQKGGSIDAADVENTIRKYSDDVEAKLTESDEEESRIIEQANSDLDSVVEDTEGAVNKIIDAAEEIGKIVKAVGDKDIIKNIMGEANNIIEACHFQDINGQRIKRTRITLHNIAGSSRSSKEMIIDHRMDAHLMQGPSEGGGCQSQADVDRLFDEN